MPDQFVFPVSPEAPTHLTPAQIAGFEPPIPDIPLWAVVNEYGYAADAGSQFDVPMWYESNEGAGGLSLESWGLYLEIDPTVVDRYHLAPMPADMLGLI